MAKEKDMKTALVTGKSASGNPHLQSVLDNIVSGYKPNRLGKSNRQIRIDNTAMIENDRPVWGYREVTNPATQSVERIPVQLFRAGWYLSPAENAMKEKLLEKGSETLKLNEAIWAAMEGSGLTVEKSAPEQTGAQVVAQ